MIFFIKQHINKITINNINDFAIKNNCFLNEIELNVIFNVIRNNYMDILNGDDGESLTILKNNLSLENYNKIIRLYNEYKVKYQSFL